MPVEKRMSLIEFQKCFGTEAQCREYLFEKRWPQGFVCPKCGCKRHCGLKDGTAQCAECRHQTSVTAGTVSQDKRGISAIQLKSTIGVTYKTARYLFARIREAMGQRDETYGLNGIVEFDDTFFSGPTAGKKRGRGTEKTKVFVVLSLNKGKTRNF